MLTVLLFHIVATQMQVLVLRCQLVQLLVKTWHAQPVYFTASTSFLSGSKCWVASQTFILLEMVITCHQVQSVWGGLFLSEIISYNWMSSLSPFFIHIFMPVHKFPAWISYWTVTYDVSILNTAVKNVCMQNFHNMDLTADRNGDYMIHVYSDATHA